MVRHGQVATGEKTVTSVAGKICQHRMVDNFRGVQIFMDFMRSAYPQKITEF